MILLLGYRLFNTVAAKIGYYSNGLGLKIVCNAIKKKAAVHKNCRFLNDVYLLLSGAEGMAGGVLKFFNSSSITSMALFS